MGPFTLYWLSCASIIGDTSFSTNIVVKYFYIDDFVMEFSIEILKISENYKYEFSHQKFNLT